MSPPKPVVLDDKGGEHLWFNRDLLTFKATSDATDGAFILFEELSQRGKVTPLHVHPDEDESFYVLEGEIRVQIDGVDHIGRPGGFLSIPRGVPHAFLVTSETARVLVLLTPGSSAAEAFFRDAGEPAPGPVLPPAGPLEIERIQAAAERHGSVRLLGPPPFEVDALVGAEAG